MSEDVVTSSINSNSNIVNNDGSISDTTNNSDNNSSGNIVNSIGTINNITNNSDNNSSSNIVNNGGSISDTTNNSDNNSSSNIVNSNGTINNSNNINNDNSNSNIVNNDGSISDTTNNSNNNSSGNIVDSNGTINNTTNNSDNNGSSNIVNSNGIINNSNNINNDNSNIDGNINKGFINEITDKGTIDTNITNSNSNITNGINNNKNGNINSTNNNNNNNNSNNDNSNDKIDNDDIKNCDNTCDKIPPKKSRIMKAISPPPLEKRPPRDPKLKKHNHLKRHMSVAKGFMDISLFGANANQLRILISFGDRKEYTFYIILACLLISLTVQLVSGITLIVKEKFDLEDAWSDYLNNVIVMQVFFIVLINVFLSGFGISLMSKEELVLIEMRKNQTLFIENISSAILKKV